MTQPRKPRRATRGDKDTLEAWLTLRTPAERQQLAGQAIAFSLNLSEFGGRSVVSRIRALQVSGLQERYILMMLDARRAPSPDTPPPPPATTHSLAEQRAKHPTPPKRRVSPEQLRLPLEEAG